jgi:hypothetical protein
MSSLAKQYCKEIVRQLKKTPVYLPGEPVNVGDIISVKTRLIDGKPLGIYHAVTSLKNLNIPFEVLQDDAPDSYIYSTKEAVGVEFIASADIAAKGSGELKVTFNRTGSIFFSAIDCTKERISDCSNLVKLVNGHAESLQDEREHLFIVTSVTTAKKALIMQSNSQNGGLTLSGEVEGLQATTGINIDANIKVKITAHKDSSFLKPWSDNVTVFFDLLRCRKDKNVVKGAHKDEKEEFLNLIE